MTDGKLHIKMSIDKIEQEIKLVKNYTKTATTNKQKQKKQEPFPWSGICRPKTRLICSWTLLQIVWFTRGCLPAITWTSEWQSVMGLFRPSYGPIPTSLINLSVNVSPQTSHLKAEQFNALHINKFIELGYKCACSMPIYTSTSSKWLVDVSRVKVFDTYFIPMYGLRTKLFMQIYIQTDNMQLAQNCWQTDRQTDR